MQGMFLSFTFVDAIVLIVVLGIIAAVIYFGFIKKSKEGGCKSCPYAKECGETSKQGKKAKKKKGECTACADKDNSVGVQENSRRPNDTDGKN